MRASPTGGAPRRAEQRRNLVLFARLSRFRFVKHGQRHDRVAAHAPPGWRYLSYSDPFDRSWFVDQANDLRLHAGSECKGERLAYRDSAKIWNPYISRVVEAPGPCVACLESMIQISR